LRITFVRYICTIASLIIFVFTNGAFGQEGNSQPLASDILLTVGGEVEKPLKISLAEWNKFSRLSVQAKGHDEKESRFEGVRLGEILQQAGVKSGKDLRGKALALYLLAEAADGYQAVFALPELDTSFTNRVILLADRRDDRPLAATVGPLQIIVPDERRHGRWVRQVKTLTIRRTGAALPEKVAQ